MVACEECVFRAECCKSIKECVAHNGGLREEYNPVVKTKPVVYAVMDNSFAEGRLLGLFWTRERAQRWLRDEWFIGAISAGEYDAASIEEYEII